MTQSMGCNNATERLVECARQGQTPDVWLAAHMDSCAACAAQFESEKTLSRGLRAMRARASAGSSLESFHRAEMRATLLNEFAASRRKPVANRWLWSLAAAAALLISTVAVREVTIRSSTPVAVAADEQNDPQQEGFIEVPFAPPLAQGELVRVVHTELQPAALASLGVNVDPSWTTEMPADLLVGQDGFPRAVRVSDEYSGAGDF